MVKGAKPLEAKPDVCWQVPLRLEQHEEDEDHILSIVREWKRRDWGDAGEEFHWWCTEAEEAYSAAEPVYRTSRDEIIELIGKPIYKHSVWEERVARARIDIEMTRLLCLKAADMMDKVGNKSAKQEIAMIKVQAPNMALKIIDDAIQAHGGGGVSEDYGLASAYAHQRTVRIVDGPDEVHRNAIAKWELGKWGTYGRDAAVPVTRGG